MTYTREFFGVAEDVDFDLQAAIEAYEWVMDNPDTAAFVVSKALFDYTTADLHHHREEVSKVVEGYIAKRADDLKRGMVRELISKSASQESIEAISKAAEMVALISKEYTPWERRRNVERQLRDAGGRFRVMGRKIAPPPQQKIPDVIATRNNVPEVKLNSEQKQRYRSDYLQVSRALNDLQKLGADRDILVLARYSNGEDSVRRLADLVTEHGDGKNSNNGLVREEDYKAGKHLTDIEADIYSGEGSDTPAQSFNVLSGMTSPTFAAYAQGAARNANFEQFGSAWNNNNNDQLYRDARTNERFWRRTAAAASLADQLAGDVLPTQASLALKTAAWAGAHAPEAEKVIGPTARKASYRYRGVEKQPDPIYQKIINDAVGRFPTSRQAHEFLIRGETRSVPRGRGPAQGLVAVDVPSPLIEEMRKRLPDADLYELNRKAGTIPPSQGIIINRNGKVVTEAVGYGEDWYLPFNLKNVNRLRGGEYIRTRAFGGPTTEDIYTGLVSGARGLTVVSHSGVFHVQFDDTFRGNRRYNDKAARMVKRYGMLLDAVKSRDVTLSDIPGDRRKDLEREAESYFEKGTPGYKQKIKELETRERNNPQLSTSRTQEIKQELLDDYAREHEAPDWSTFVMRQRRVVEAEAQRNAPPGEPEDSIQNRVEQKMRDYGDVTNLDSGLNKVGLTEKANKQLAAAQREYEAQLSPLRLDGIGYQKAIQALRDQFPYYISDATYIEPKKGKLDEGYVKPRFIRPEGALAGYYDNTIQGIGQSGESGKFSADQTNYQNWAVRSGQQLKLKTRTGSGTDDETKTGTAPTVKEEEKKPSAQSATDARLALARAIVTSKKWGAEALGGAANYRGEAIDPKVVPMLAKEYDRVFDPDLERTLANNPAASKELDEQLQKIRTMRLFDISPDLWDAWIGGGQIKPRKVPRDESGVIISSEVLPNIGKVIYDFDRAREGRPTQTYQEAWSKLRQHPAATRLRLESVTLNEPAETVLARMTAAAHELQSESKLADLARRTGDIRTKVRPEAERLEDVAFLAEASSVALQLERTRQAQAEAERLSQETANLSRPVNQVSIVNIPGAATAEQGATAIIEGAKAAGFTPDEMGNVVEQIRQNPFDPSRRSTIIQEPEEPKKP